LGGDIGDKHHGPWLCVGHVRPPDRRLGVQDPLDEHAVVPVGAARAMLRAGASDVERQAGGVDEPVVLVPRVSRSVGSDQSSATPFRPHADRVEAGPRPVQRTFLADPVEHGLVEAVEDAGLRHSRIRLQ
jgi:hypothetical protein